MGVMAVMDVFGTSNLPILAAFFIGLMTAISPCPLATNIAAIAYTSKKINDSRHTLMIGFLYTLGRMFTYISLASLIVWSGLNMQFISLPLQRYGERLIGPLLIIIGVVMLDVLRFRFLKGSDKLNRLRERIASKGFLGAFLLGAIFALAFCPFSAVLFFGMLIPLALKAGDGIVIPSFFAFATGLPVILFSFLLVSSISKLGAVMNKVQLFERCARRTVSVIFIGIGIYYSVMLYLR